jgi:hypothetical protein
MFGQDIVNRLQHSWQVAIYIAVPESKNAEARTSKIFVAVFVERLITIQIVLPTIDLDNEPVLHAHEIDYMTAAG